MLKAGYKLAETETMTLNDVMLVMEAQNKKDEDNWNIARTLIATVINHSGFGTTEAISPSEVIHLRMDDENIVRPITTVEEARELIEGM
ncbi:hypothetical protein [Sphingobacterium multivorum]|uniref:hypothetical protein n=1 Tax=Sphingobacterium multivorum TaxID=28454 RepID=UPI0031B9C6A9